MYAVNFGFEMAAEDARRRGYGPQEGADTAMDGGVKRTISLPSSTFSDSVPWRTTINFGSSGSTVEIDDHGLAFSANKNDDGGEEKRAYYKRVPFFNEVTGAREEGTSCFSSSTLRPANDDDDYERRKQQAALKCQLLDSGIGGVSDAARTDAVGNGVGDGEGEPATKNSSEESSLNDGFLNGAKGNRIITATAPPHLRSYYSQENNFGLRVKREESSTDDKLSKLRDSKRMDENFGADNRLKSFWSTITGKSPSTGPSDVPSPSTSSQCTSASNVCFPHARFDNGGDIEDSNLHSNPLFRGRGFENRPPPPPYNVAVGAALGRPSRPSDVGIGSVVNGQEKPVGQAPTFVTAANRKLDHGDHTTSSDHRSARRLQHRSVQQNPNDGWTSSNLTPRFDSSLSSPKPSVSFDSSTTGGGFENDPKRRPIFGLNETDLTPAVSTSSMAAPDISAGQPMQRGFSMENMQHLSVRHPSLPTWPSTPCIAANEASSNSFYFQRPMATSTGSYCVQTATVTVPTSIHSIQSSRVSSYVNPLPEIRENVAVISLPTTPTASEPSPYLLPPISSDQRSPWFTPPWVSVRTGVVSRMVKAVSCDSPAGRGLGEGSKSPKDVDYLSNLHRVTKLAEHFEKGDVDHVGPLKLYHAQVYKRELEKICAENFGSVLTKAQRFDNGVISPPRPPPPQLLDVKDYGFYQRASFSSSCVSDDIWARCAGAMDKKDSKNEPVRMYLGSDVAKAKGRRSSSFRTEPRFERIPEESSSATETDGDRRRSSGASVAESTSKRLSLDLERALAMIMAAPLTHSQSESRPKGVTLGEEAKGRPGGLLRLQQFLSRRSTDQLINRQQRAESVSAVSEADSKAKQSWTRRFRRWTTGISVTKTTFPTTSEPNLNVGLADLPDFTLTDYNDQDGAVTKREGRRSRRTSYVMATTASPRNVVAASVGTHIGGRDQGQNREPLVSYPVSEDASSGARHEEIEEDEGEEVECGNRRENTRGSSSLVNTQTAAAEEDIARTLLGAAANGGRGQTRLQRQALGQEGPRLSTLQIPDSMERKNSSGSSLSVTPTPTPSPTSGAKHARIQRFINFFSGDHSSLTRYSDGCVAGPGSSTSLSSCYTGASSSSNQAGMIGDQQGKRISTNLTSPPTIEGSLAHKQLVSQIGGGRKRSTDRNWRDYWALLHGSSLYLCRERPTVRYRSETAITEDASLCYGLPEDALCIDVESCIADIAYDYLKRKHVFRVTTQRQTEHLFQATDSQTMIRWIESLQRCSANENQLDGISSSMALIIKRYEAQSQSVSPSVKQRRSTGVGGSKSSAMPNGQQELTNRCENDGARFSSAVASAVSPNRTHSAGVNSNPPADKMERAEKGDHTPGKTRKWRRVRKSGSCPVPSPRANESGTNPDAMFGARLEDCPTSGEDDFVPLIVQLCVKVVESQGLEAVGVYRIPGNTAAVNSLISTLDKGFENANFNDSRWRDVNVVSSLLKAYFRKLPDPLLTDKLYQHFIDASRMDNHAQKMRRIRSLIEKLPKVNYETLKYLLFHLRRVVSHSSVNKMEARNLALMFGPSLVRPCGDSSMTTMVTHMSDQCKIVELLITYCDWIFSPAGKNSDAPNVPPPLTGSAETDLANTSFADMTDLLRRVKTTEEDLERTKDSIVKSILNVRRGSRKLSKGKLISPESAASIESSGTPQAPSFVSCSGSSTTSATSASYNGHHSHAGHEPVSRDSVKSASASPSVFNERNIDEEIESRQQRIAAQSQAVISTSSKGVSTDPRNVDHQGHVEANGTNGTNGVAKEANEYVAKVDVGVVFRSNNDNVQLAAEEMRRRHDHIYAARRIFIVGTEGNEILQGTPPVDTVAKMDLLAQHSRHLNVNPQSLDVLSPETREKIRRLQTDSQLLRSKGHWQQQQLKKVTTERQRIEMAWERAKQDYEQDDFLDDLAENPRAGLAMMTATSNPHLSVASTDALSTSSDYSTTSSVLAGYDGGMEKRKPLPLQQQQQKLMSVSCTGALPLSDCSSENPSPNSTNSPKPTPRSPMGFGVTYSPTKTSSAGTSASRSSAEQQQQQQYEAHPYQPPYNNGTQRNDYNSANSTPQRRQQMENPQSLYDRSRLKHVAPEVLFHSKVQPDDQRSSVATSDSGSGVKYKISPRHSSLQKAKPWYDELGDEENDVESRMRASVASSSDASYREPKNALDQNANNLTAKTASAASSSNNTAVANAATEEKRTRILAPAERGTSRISQKIKFRSKSSSAEKRKDNRRHTLTDMETLKNVLFGGGSSREHSVKEKTVSTTQSPTSNNAHIVSPPTAANNSKQSRTGKLKAWLKESFRKSSPDLYDAENLDDGAAEDEVPKSAV